MKTIFEKEVKGYKLAIVSFEGRENIYLMNGDNKIEITIAGIFDSYEHLRNKTYSLIEFEIQTKSIGSQSVLGIEKMIKQYQKAVEAVEAFEGALQDLEILEMRVSESK